MEWEDDQGTWARENCWRQVWSDGSELNSRNVHTHYTSSNFTTISRLTRYLRVYTIQ